MKQISLFILILTLLLTASLPAIAQENGSESIRAPRPFPATTVTEEGITVELFFESLPQGRAGLVRVTGENLAGARVRFREVTADCFYMEDDAYYGFIVANMDQTPRVYEFSVLAFLDDGMRVTVPAQLRIVQGGFIRQDFNLGADRAYLVDPEVERLEFARLDSIFATYTTERFWDDGFQLPIDSELTSTFGAFRIINETVETRHTGWDLRAPVGTPVMTMGSGEVAFAGLMDIRGNFVVIDHGYGMFSTYSHLSQVHVTRGQTVTKGQIIGVSGNTGRSGGPHLHWEMVINGQFIDSADFMRLWLP
jgi:murein DD-endopeptidase MepM/ murein hydrolase activator NlpD